MKWKHYLGISILGLFVLIGLGIFQAAPGYMDAEYYYSMGLRIATKKGLTEPFIWNYLAGVSSIPHPGFSYWMPMPAFISALGIWISGLDNFIGAKIIHILMAALVPAITMKLVWDRTANRSASILAGLLAVFPVFYSIFLGTTDSFAIVMMLGGVFLVLSSKKNSLVSFALIGIIAGLMHLSRADGFIWMIAGIYCAVRAPEKRIAAILCAIGGYLLCMAPWFSRNYAVTGQIMPSGLSQVFWIREYNDLYTYYPAGLNFDSWISQGARSIFRTYFDASLANLKTALLVQGQIILAPFVLIGAWKHRRDTGFQAVFLCWLGVFFVMSIIFPFAGMRGGYLHSSAAFQTLFWCLAAIGFFEVIDWGVENRSWTHAKAGKVFGSLLVVMVVVAAGFVHYNRVIGDDLQRPVWNSSYLKAELLADQLQKLGIEETDLIMINNPPGYYAASGRSAIVIPSGGIEPVLAASKDFGAKYMVLESNHPLGLSELYQDPDRDSRLIYLGKVDDALIFQFKGME